MSAESEAPPPKPPAPSAPSSTASSTATDERNDKPESFPLPMPLDIRSIALTFLASITAIGVLYIGRNLLVPILFGVGIAFLLSPAVDLLERWRIPRVLAAAVLLISLAAALGGIGYHVSGQATQLIGELPAAARKINDLFTRSTEGEPGSKVAQLQEAAEELTREAPETPRQAATRPVATPVRIVSPPPQMTDYLLTGSIGIAGMVAQVVLVLFLVFFSLASGDLFKLKLVRLTGPSLSQRKITVQIIDEIGQTISRYLRNLALVCTIVGVATWLAFSALGVPNAALWGVLAAIANTVPYFGPTVVWVSATVAAYLHFDTVGMALATGGTSLLITGTEGMLLTPTLMSRTANMNTVAMFVGLLFWGWLWGFWGMVLAVPLLMTLKVIADRIEDLEPIGELLGD